MFFPQIIAKLSFHLVTTAPKSQNAGFGDAFPLLQKKLDNFLTTFSFSGVLNVDSLNFGMITVNLLKIFTTEWLVSSVTP